MTYLITKFNISLESILFIIFNSYVSSELYNPLFLHMSVNGYSISCNL